MTKLPLSSAADCKIAENPQVAAVVDMQSDTVTSGVLEPGINGAVFVPGAQVDPAEK
jgi:hypothetical protein